MFTKNSCLSALSSRRITKGKALFLCNTEVLCPVLLDIKFNKKKGIRGLIRPFNHAWRDAVGNPRDIPLVGSAPRSRAALLRSACVLRNARLFPFARSLYDATHSSSEFTFDFTPANTYNTRSHSHRSHTMDEQSYTVIFWGSIFNLFGLNLGLPSVIKPSGEIAERGKKHPT